MKIALGGKVITNFLVFSSFLIIKQTNSITVVSWQEERTSHVLFFFNNLRCLADYRLITSPVCFYMLLLLETDRTRESNIYI